MLQNRSLTKFSKGPSLQMLYKILSHLSKEKVIRFSKELTQTTPQFPIIILYSHVFFFFLNSPLLSHPLPRQIIQGSSSRESFNIQLSLTQPCRFSLYAPGPPQAVPLTNQMAGLQGPEETAGHGAVLLVLLSWAPLFLGLPGAGDPGPQL